MDHPNSDSARASDDDGANPTPVIPVIDHGACEGKAACVRVCPERLFRIQRITDEDFGRLSWVGRLKSQVHRRRTAYAVDAERCTGCGLCVPACPERAIVLVPRQKHP